MAIDDLKSWIGRTEEASDTLPPATRARLSGVLDHESEPWPAGEMPPLGHWLAFLSTARQSELDVDGHPHRGTFLPPVSLPRRMWAGSRLEFLAPVAADARLDRRSTILDVAEKVGASGRMIFVTARHEISVAGKVCVREDQDIVYREAPSANAAPAPAKPRPAPRATDSRRTIKADPTLLFRFSALTYNSHRIHYDREYCREAEGYPGLVVHGPLTAVLLMDHFLRWRPSARPTRFNFRAQKPLFDLSPFSLCLAANAGGADVWTEDADGDVTMSAVIEAA